MNSIGAPAEDPEVVDGWLPLLRLSVQEVFATMLGTKLAPVSEPAPTTRLDWTAMVGLAGKLYGVLSFSCEEKSAILIASKMLGAGLSPTAEQAGDALGEMCNIIAGNFKHKINGVSARSVLSPPTVVTGKDYRVRQPAARSMRSLRTTFAFEGSPIYVALDVRK